MFDMVAAVNEEASCVSGLDRRLRNPLGGKVVVDVSERLGAIGHSVEATENGAALGLWLPDPPRASRTRIDLGLRVEEAGLGCGVGRRWWGCHAEVGVRRWRCHTTARGTHQQPLLNQIGLVDVLDRLGRFAHGNGEGRKANRAPTEATTDRIEHRPRCLVETEFIDAKEDSPSAATAEEMCPSRSTSA